MTEDKITKDYHNYGALNSSFGNEFQPASYQNQSEIKMIGFGIESNNGVSNIHHEGHSYIQDMRGNSDGAQTGSNQLYHHCPHVNSQDFPPTHPTNSNRLNPELQKLPQRSSRTSSSRIETGNHFRLNQIYAPNQFSYTGNQGGYSKLGELQDINIIPIQGPHQYGKPAQTHPHHSGIYQPNAACKAHLNGRGKLHSTYMNYQYEHTHNPHSKNGNCSFYNGDARRFTHSVPANNMRGAQCTGIDGYCGRLQHISSTSQNKSPNPIQNNNPGYLIHETNRHTNHSLNMNMNMNFNLNQNHSETELHRDPCEDEFVAQQFSGFPMQQLHYHTHPLHNLNNHTNINHNQNINQNHNITRVQFSNQRSSIFNTPIQDSTGFDDISAQRPPVLQHLQNSALDDSIMLRKNSTSESFNHRHLQNIIPTNLAGILHSNKHTPLLPEKNGIMDTPENCNYLYGLYSNSKHTIHPNLLSRGSITNISQTNQTPPLSANSMNITPMQTNQNPQFSAYNQISPEALTEAHNHQMKSLQKHQCESSQNLRFVNNVNYLSSINAINSSISLNSTGQNLNIIPSSSLDLNLQPSEKAQQQQNKYLQLNSSLNINQSAGSPNEFINSKKNTAQLLPQPIPQPQPQPQIQIPEQSEAQNQDAQNEAIIPEKTPSLNEDDTKNESEKGSKDTNVILNMTEIQTTPKLNGKKRRSRNPENKALKLVPSKYSKSKKEYMPIFCINSTKPKKQKRKNTETKHKLQKELHSNADNQPIISQIVEIQAIKEQYPLSLSQINPLKPFQLNVDELPSNGNQDIMNENEDSAEGEEDKMKDDDFDADAQIEKCSPKFKKLKKLSQKKKKLMKPNLQIEIPDINPSMRQHRHSNAHLANCPHGQMPQFAQMAQLGHPHINQIVQINAHNGHNQIGQVQQTIPSLQIQPFGLGKFLPLSQNHPHLHHHPHHQHNHHAPLSTEDHSQATVVQFSNDNHSIYPISHHQRHHHHQRQLHPHYHHYYKFNPASFQNLDPNLKRFSNSDLKYLLFLTRKEKAQAQNKNNKILNNLKNLSKKVTECERFLEEYSDSDLIDKNRIEQEQLKDFKMKIQHNLHQLNLLRRQKKSEKIQKHEEKKEISSEEMNNDQRISPNVKEE